jgi:uncharacterized protein
MLSEDERLDELEDALLALPLGRDPMTLSEFDGFCAGLHCCPDRILPSEWLAVALGEDDDAPPLESREDAEAAVAPMLAHYNRVGEALEARRFDPVFDYDEPDGVLWASWLAGFVTAMDLRPGLWTALIGSDDREIGMAVAGLTMLAGMAEGEIVLPEGEDAALKAEAPDLIADWAQLLYDHRLGAGRAAPVRPGPKVGRNEPCPCGSGKKYKKCCGAH